MNYTKQILTFEQQIELLRQRGLIIEDEDEAIAILDRTSYFRLADYWRPMEKDRSTHLFRPNTHFRNIVAIYRFDAELKELLFKAILQIEVATRSKMIRFFSTGHNPFWFADESLSENTMLYQSNISNIRREISRSQEEFITEHFTKYDTPEFPPVWKTLEVISLAHSPNSMQTSLTIPPKTLWPRNLGCPNTSS